MAEVVVVIGATSGVGLAAAQALATAGYEVVISGHTSGSVERTLGQIRGARGLPLDFSDPSSVTRFFANVERLDHLALVGSGTAAWGAFADLRLESLQTALAQKFFPYVLCTQAALPRLRADGSITFTIGGASRSAIPGTSGVAAVNGAIQAMALTLAKELAPRRVNVLSPGLVDTPMYDWMSAEEKAGFFRQMGGTLPVGRVGRAEEIADALLFLIRNQYTTGAILDVDGGGRLR